MSDYQGRTDVEFYAVEGPNTFLMSCRPCEGTGKTVLYMNDDLSPIAFSNLSCSVCNGRGIVRFESPDVPVRHASCHGTGRAWHRTSSIDLTSVCALERPYYCMGCRGFGIVSLIGTIKHLSGDPNHEAYLKQWEWDHSPGNAVSSSQIRWLEERNGSPFPKRNQPKKQQINGQTA